MVWIIVFIAILAFGVPIFKTLTASLSDKQKYQHRIDEIQNRLKDIENSKCNEQASK